MKTEFQRVAIANRGEPAARFLKSAVEWGRQRGHPLCTIALFTEPDRQALFVREADEAWELGPATVADGNGRTRSSYVDFARLEAALTQTRAEAVWPGWGFAAEDAAFAGLCERLGVVFIGPGPAAMRVLGDKVAAKQLAERAGVPVAPWSGGPVATLDDALRHAEAIGYPALVKAAGGGGGRGIRRVDRPSDMESALACARAEAFRSFGDDAVYLEKLLTGTRHVEVQVIADAYGTAWAVGLRDCTLQRRHQKVVEESAEWWLGARQAELREAALRMAAAAGYRSAGTFEFLVDPASSAWFFMEANARLQVEHPVTEATSGLDLVKLQLDVASGAPLRGDPPPPRGHAIEVRLNAEDPELGFAPAPGAVALLRLPSGPGVRVDTGVEEGDTIPAEFDSMIAKLIAHGQDREEALARMSRALSQTSVLIQGGTTNRAFLMDLLAQPDFRGGRVDVGWLDRLMAAPRGARRPSAAALVRAAIDAYEEETEVARARFFSSAARGRPEVDGEAGRTVELTHRGQAYRLLVRRLESCRYEVALEGREVAVAVQRLAGAPVRERRVRGSQWRLLCGRHSFHTTSVQQGPSTLVEVDGVPHRITREQQGLVRAPSSALVVAVAVKEGDQVSAGDRLLVLEAMKMETSLLAPFGGRVREVLVHPNVQVPPGAPLLFIEAEDEQPRESAAEQIDLAELCEEPAGADTREAVLARMRSILLGFDLAPAQLQPLMARWQALAGEPSRALVEEARLLAIFVDGCALFRREPPRDEALDEVRRSAGEYLFTYLRDVGAGGAGLPEAFVERLRRALRHYGVRDLTPRTAELDEALFRICTAHEREELHAAAAFALLERWLQAPAGALAELGPRLSALLERTVAETRQRHPALHDLAREVRFRHFERPLVEEARHRVYAEAEAHLLALCGPAPDPQRSRHVEALVDCPQPLAALLSGRFQEADASLRQAILEILTRRYYRIRELGSLITEDHEGRCAARVAYRHQGRTIHVIATHANAQRLSEAARLSSRLMAEVPPDDDVALDFYLWERDGLVDGDAMADALRAVLDGAGFTRPVRRVVAALAGPAAQHAGGMQCFTFRQGASGFVEERFYRGVHPMMAKRLHMERLAHFELERLPSPEDVYVLLGRARGNPRDERLFVMAEVRDLTPVRGPGGEVVQLPHLERMLMEALAGMRRVQARRPSRRRLHGNRLLLYVWPPFEFGVEELEPFVQRLAPATEGLGLEAVALHVRRPGEGGLVDAVIEVSNPAGQGTVVTITAPTAALIAPLSEYEQKVMRLAQRDLTYPYEIVRMLTPPVNGAHSEFPPGEFTEYDLEGERLRPVHRPFGRNEANVVLGLIRNFTPGHPDGIARVLLLGDPSRDLGALAEPECARILAALDLAAELRLPVDWIALSAGARISMESGTENMDWIARVLRRLVEFTQAGGEVNVVVNGINVGAQPYWNAEATMLMHTRGILVMMPDSAMVLTGKRALEYSGGVSAEDNQGIGGYERIMGPNGQAQYFARDLGEACHLLLRHHELTFVAAGERFPRRVASGDPAQRDVCAYPYARADGQGFRTVGDVFSDETNPGRKKPFDIRCVMGAVADQDHVPLERWAAWQDAETTVVWDARLGGRPVCLLGIESRPVRRLGFVPADGPDQWTGGTLFPQSSRKLARALNAASGNRPAVVLANLTGFDGSPESLRQWQLEYGAEIGRAVVNFDGPLVFCVISRYHGGAFVVFSSALNDDLQVMALEGTYASVIGGAPAAAVVFAREVDRRVAEDPRVQALESEAAAASPGQAARVQARLEQLSRAVHSEMLGRVAEEFDAVHTVQRAQLVGSVHAIVPASQLRPRLIAAVESGIAAVIARGRGPAPAEVPASPAALAIVS